MTAHDWQHHVRDAGHLGAYEIWECRRCGATNWGFPEFRDDPDPRQFYACGCGPTKMDLPADCDMAQIIIAGHLPVCPHGGKR